MDLILQKLTELGVSRIIPVSMERSIVKLDKERFNKKESKMGKIFAKKQVNNQKN